MGLCDLLNIPDVKSGITMRVFPLKPVRPLDLDVPRTLTCSAT